MEKELDSLPAASGEDVIDVREPLVPTAMRTPDEPSARSKYGKKLGLLGVVLVLIAAAIFFSFEQGIAQGLIWSEEMEEIKMANSLPDESGLRYMLFENMTWGLAEALCDDRGFKLCEPMKPLCTGVKTKVPKGEGKNLAARRLRRRLLAAEDEDKKPAAGAGEGEKKKEGAAEGKKEEDKKNKEAEKEGAAASKKEEGKKEEDKKKQEEGKKEEDKKKTEDKKKKEEAAASKKEEDKKKQAAGKKEWAARLKGQNGTKWKNKGRRPGVGEGYGVKPVQEWEEQDQSWHSGLCFPKRCSARFHKTIDRRFTPVIDEEEGSEWLRMDTCEVVKFDEDEEKPGVVACCNKETGQVAEAFPSEVMQAAQKAIQEQRKKDGLAPAVPPKKKWSFVKDSVRSNDPFLKSKLKGQKMKSFNAHVTEKASQHLGNKTIAEHINDAHGKIVEHVEKLVDKAMEVHTSVMNAVKGSSAPAGPAGAVSGKKQDGDPIKSGAAAAVPGGGERRRSVAGGQ